jgi:transcriptional regulator with XRE-family HTH domain
MKHQANFEVTGSELRAARSQLKWSICRLASESGVHRSTIARIEAGKSRGWPEIVRALQCTLESGGAVFAVQPSAKLPAVWSA